MDRDSIFKEVLEELRRCEDFVKDKIYKKLTDADLSHPDMKAIDYIHDACHTLMLKRGPIPAMSELRRES